ncbi:Peptidase S10, serine carboxypeptidase [Cynara cardunculus var. scolymus]|uniref:Peptidase S10, serine carboxypeptidase n=1 Tax=Cynara cardunculus var. scolymus TaxID=59895 RepID=A0A118K2X0_CYNCS|nr:Peptidase S10, serine carboxypeptidase [Cynara cardunculus var. scolymus]
MKGHFSKISSLLVSLLAFITLLHSTTAAATTAAARQHRYQRLKDKIVSLPGQPANVSFHQYSGYITVDKKQGRALFYWLIEVPTNNGPASSKPLVLWLNGGPGCSSIAYGAFEEVGPFRRPIFFSSILRLELVFRTRTLPSTKSPAIKEQLSQIIVRLNKGVKNPEINFKGFLVGNPLLDDYHDNIGTFEFWWNHGLISDTTYQILNETCPGSDNCIIKHTKIYMNRPDVQKAFHANVTRLPYPWITCSDIVRGSWTDSPTTMLPIFKELIKAGIRIWVFSGDTDAVLPLTGTRYSIKALNLKTLIDWHAWYDKDKVGGWSQVYEGMTYLTVKGAGHEVPMDRPRLALTLFAHFLKNITLPSSAHN